MKALMEKSAEATYETDEESSDELAKGNQNVFSL
jgi:hypothetical protein